MAKAVMKDKKEIVLRSVAENTVDWTEEVFSKEEKQTEKARGLSKAISEMTISTQDKDKLAEALSLATGEAVRIEKDEDLEFRPMTAIVLTKADKHNYVTGTVLISLGDGTAVDQDGKVGGYIKPSRKIVRPATADEVKSIPEAQIKGLMKEVNIIIA